VEELSQRFLAMSRFSGIPIDDTAPPNTELGKYNHVMNNAENDLNDAQKEILFMVGEALLHVQTLEFVLSRCLTCVFPPEAEMTVDAIYALDTKNQTKPLGLLLTALREAVEIEPDFDSRLREYLKKRNLFVHGLFLDERFDLNTEEGRESLAKFVDDIYDDVNYLRTAFTGLYAQWRGAIEGEEQGLEAVSDAKRRKWTQYMEKHESVTIPKLRLKPGNAIGKGFASKESKP
jgi:hypothetical protein